MTGGGFVRRSGFGLGRLIVSRGYGADGRALYENVPLACFLGEASNARGLESSLLATVLNSEVFTGAFLDGAVFAPSFASGVALPPSSFAGSVVAVMVEGIVQGHAMLASTVVAVGVAGRAIASVAFSGSVVGTVVEGRTLQAAAMAGRVIRCGRLDS